MNSRVRMCWSSDVEGRGSQCLLVINTRFITFGLASTTGGLGIDVKEERMNSHEKNGLFYELFYRTRKNMFIILYASCVICIGTLITILANTAKVPLRIEFLIGFLIAIVGIIVGLFFSMLLDLPEVGWKFDEIKNDIASGKIRTPEEFAKRVSKFMLANFNFILINVQYIFIHIVDSTHYYSDPAIPDVIREKEMDSIILRSQQTQDVIYIGKSLVSGC
jgi:hypothetical protein